MATRDNQTLQIIIISLCFLLVLSAVAAVFGWRYKADAERGLADMTSERDQIETRFREQSAELNVLKQFLGFQEEDNLETIQAEYEKDMQQLGETFSEDNKNYRTIAEHVQAERDQLATREQDAQTRLAQLKEDYLALEAECKNRIAEFQKKSQEDATALAEALNTFQEQRKKFEEERQELLSAAEKVEQRYEQQLAERDQKLQEATQEITDTSARMEQILAGRQQDHTVFERPDGRVTWVNQSTGTVWVNLGYADSLREQISFSVYEQGTPVAGQNEPKAKIEVTRIAGDHLSEARILEDEPLNPIVPGDQIYSPVWERGKQVRFALTGVIDIDGDGRDDSERVRRIITSNGGVVDSYVNEQGEQEGQMTVNTRFLVVGDQPNQGRDADLLRAQADTRQAMLAEASKKGVDEISVDKFLSFVGWHPEEKVVTLGSGARASDFPPQPNGNSAGGAGFSTGSNSRTSNGNSFRRRYPATPD